MATPNTEDWKSLAQVAEKERDDWKRKAEEARYLGDNHHNALACPYCNPDRFDPVASQAREAGLREALSDLLVRIMDDGKHGGDADDYFGDCLICAAIRRGQDVLRSALSIGEE